MFTKGPWCISKHNANIIYKKGEPLNCVASVNVGILNGRDPDIVLSANANLIAAAPDMYSALEIVCKECEGGDKCYGCEVKQALAKARGEE